MQNEFQSKTSLPFIYSLQWPAEFNRWRPVFYLNDSSSAAQASGRPPYARTYGADVK